ncbi:hypothetical protein BURMUCGD1_0594 [Burkholderia multivorans CGD1]|nr:hypothetical protein BURMUCGD1_0594 [Burkholderia multivorans CGD1]
MKATAFAPWLFRFLRAGRAPLRPKEKRCPMPPPLASKSC